MSDFSWLYGPNPPGEPCPGCGVQIYPLDVDGEDCGECVTIRWARSRLGTYT